jgi:hypothetical protein
VRYLNIWIEGSFVCLGAMLLKLFVNKHFGSRNWSLHATDIITLLYWERFWKSFIHISSAKHLCLLTALVLHPSPISCLSNGTYRRQILSLKLCILSLYSQYTLSLYPQFSLPVGVFWYVLGDMFKSQSFPFSCSLKNWSAYPHWAKHFSEDFPFKQF